MKNLMLVLCMLVSAVAFADSSDTKTFNFDGSSEVAELLLQTEKTRTEWRQVRVLRTCYRVTYRRQCTTQGQSCRTRCDRNRQNCRRVCTGGRRVCRDVPVRRAYSCYQWENQAYEVHDYYVNTNATLNFDLNEVDGGASENFKVNVRGEKANLSVKGSKNYLVLLNSQNQSQVHNGSVKDINISYDINFIKAKRVKETLGQGVKNVKLKNGVLNFSVGKGFNTNEFTQNLRIYKYKRIGKDTLLLNQDMTDNDMDIVTNANTTSIQINLKNLGITLPKKMRVIMTTSFKTGSAKVLNTGVKTKTSANWIFK